MLCLLFLLLCTSLSQVHPEEKSSRAGDFFFQARQHFENQEWEKAKIAATKALEVNPRLADAEVMLGLIATVQTQFSSAEQHFLRAVSLQPQNDHVQGYLASTYLQQKRYAEATHTFKKVLRLNPRNQAANYNLGLIALIAEKPEEALTYFQQVEHANPADIPALTGILECQLLLKHTGESHQLTTKLEGLLQPQDPRLFQIATMLALHQQYDSAVAILERVRQVYPQSYDVNYNLALAYLRSEKYELAAQTLEPLLGQPKAAEAYSLLAQAREKLQLPDQALLAYQKAAELEPGNEDYCYDHAYALLQYVSNEAAMTAFSSGARDFPNSWRMRVGLGSAYYLAGRYTQAIQALLEAVKIEPTAKVIYYLLGKGYESAGDWQAAIREAFKAYLVNKRQDPWAYYHYGNMQYLEAQAELRRDFEGAKAYLKTALSLNPDFAEAHLQMGIIEQSEGRLPESVQSLEKAIRANPSLPAAHYRLALVYQRLGNKEKSKAEFDLFEKLKSETGNEERQAVVQSLSEQKK
jgi:tetratricopeptide (TPR) repeat protein